MADRRSVAGSRFLERRFDPSSHKGKITAYDSPIYIADAALYLMATQPDLGIKNPYALDDKQFQASIDLLKQQKSTIGEYWVGLPEGDPGLQERRLGGRDHLAGHRECRPGRGGAVEATCPRKARPGWSDTWMVATKASTRTAPTCGWTTSSRRRRMPGRRILRRGSGQQVACAKTADKDHCETFHADDEAYFYKVWYWNTPISSASTVAPTSSARTTPNGRQAWQEIKG